MRLMFHYVEQSESVFDEDGIEVSSLEVAREKALRAARETMAEDLKDTGHINLNRRIDITDVEGKIVLSVPFTDVVTIGHA